MGHTNSKMVEQVYAHLNDSTLREAMAVLPTGPPGGPGCSCPNPLNPSLRSLPAALAAHALPSTFRPASP